MCRPTAHDAKDPRRLVFFDLLLSKSHSPMYDVRAFYMNYECTVRSQIDPDLYIERISQFIERNDLQELHLSVWDPDDYLPSLQHIGGVQILELGLAVSNEWEPHLTPLSWCTETLANIAQTSGLGYLTLTFEFTPERRCIPMPSTRWPQWEDLDRALLELELEELSLVFALRFVPNRYEDLNREVFGVDEQRNYETQMKSKIQTWILGSCLPEVGKQYFGRDDPSENIGTFRFEGESIARYYSSMILEAPSL
ncbi:hypothetical protein CPB85DRAFT_362164 [Mucidula mucida]|nr:hypothetical protein CPB85DRAFT_362164 [Mucidula mucida]